MRSVYLVLSIIAFGSAEDVLQPNQQINSNAIIRQLFEMLRYSIKNGYNDIPIMDPFEFDNKEYKISLPFKILSINAIFNNGVITGLGSFEIQNTKFIKEEISVDLSINFPLVIFKAENYKMNGVIYEIIPIDGKGALELQIRNLTLSGKVYLKQSEDEKSILIKEITHSKFNVQHIISDLEIDNNIDDIANAIITDLASSYINRFNQFIIKAYGETLIELINKFLNNFDSWQIMSTLL